jgi:hypothetical protein
MDDMNAEELFAELYSMHQRHSGDYNHATTFGDEKMMNQIIYKTKPGAYQMQLTGIKDHLLIEAI